MKIPATFANGVPLIIAGVLLAIGTPSPAASTAGTQAARTPATIPAGPSPLGVAVNERTGTMYFTNELLNTVSVIGHQPGKENDNRDDRGWRAAG